MIFAYFGHAWLLFYSLRHPLIALATLGVLTVIGSLRVAIPGIKRWFQEWQEDRAQKANAGHAFAVYLEQREEMQQAAHKARQIKERFTGADIAGSVTVSFGTDGHPKLDIKLERLADRDRANQIATDCVLGLNR
jgi:hypothetical protein